jgi:hypothetical protein
MSVVGSSTGTRWDLLLRWMTARGAGSGSQFRDAVEYLLPDEQRARHFDVALRLCAMGHVEFDFHGSDLRWNAVPASCYSVERGGRRLLGLCGLLPDEAREALVRGRLEVLQDKEFFLYNETLLREFVRDTAQARELLSRSGVAISANAYQDLRLRLPTVTDMLMAGEEIEFPDSATQFNPSSGRFDDEITLNTSFTTGLYRIDAYPRPKYFWISVAGGESPLCYLVDRTIGMWGAYAPSRLRVSLTGGRLKVPAFPSLPVLCERMLYLGGARCVSKTRSNVEFDHVPGSLVGALIQKLPLSLEKV